MTVDSIHLPLASLVPIFFNVNILSLLAQFPLEKESTEIDFQAKMFSFSIYPSHFTPPATTGLPPISPMTEDLTE